MADVEKVLAEELGITWEDNADLMEQMLGALEADAANARRRVGMDNAENVDYAALMRYLDLVASFGKLVLVLNDQDAILDSPSDIKEAIEEVKNAIFLMRRRWDI